MQDTAPALTAKKFTQQAIPPGFLSFRDLLAVLPLSERTARAEIQRGRIPVIRLPRSRRLLFHWPTVEKALLRFQRGGIS